MIFDSSLNIENSFKRHVTAWELLLGTPKLAALKKLAIPTTLSVKVADKAKLFAILYDNESAIEQIHVGTVNDRYIASAALKEPFQDLPILKILERRSGSKDPLGLDSLDYLVNDLEETFQICQSAGLNIIKEHNDMHAWLSLRFGSNNEFEAKFTDHLVLEVGLKELRLISEQIKRQLHTPRPQTN